MTPNQAAIFALCYLVAPQTVGAFAPSSADAAFARPQTSLMAKQPQQPAQPAERRAFLGSVLTSVGVAAAATGMPTSPAWADEEEKVEDLAMPTAEDQKALDVSVVSILPVVRTKGMLSV